MRKILDGFAFSDKSHIRINLKKVTERMTVEIFYKTQIFKIQVSVSPRSRGQPVEVG